ncbi:MAG: hypothetical protein BWY66_00161 [bacterium ADurb.Bin374]|nr:MAG: hypothetical protein BWY66_00161 [bacterium ADurb.Bin374]
MVNGSNLARGLLSEMVNEAVTSGIGSPVVWTIGFDQSEIVGMVPSRTLTSQDLMEAFEKAEPPPTAVSLVGRIGCDSSQIALTGTESGMMLRYCFCAALSMRELSCHLTRG